MTITQQIENFINNAPKYGVTTTEVKIIAPVLENFALELKHLEYYILQTLDQRWLMTTLSKRTAPDLQKNVVYAFPTPQDAINFLEGKNAGVLPKKILIIDILAQLLAIPTVNSLIFFENPGNLNNGTEVSREKLRQTITHYLQQYNSRNIHNNIA